MRNLSPAAAVSLERIVLVLRSTMIRKPLTLAIVLLIAGLAPAAAIIGFCTRMPCCSHAPDAMLAPATERGDCCTTITCYDTPAAKLTGSSAAPTVAFAPALAALSAVPRVAPAPARTFNDTSPRGAVDRLALLSILLI